MKAIKNILEEATTNQWPYPKTFEVLKGNGLQNYEVHFANGYKAQFWGTFGYFKEESLDGYTPIKAHTDFNREGIKEAVFKHVMNKTPYLDFLRDVATNGATHYRVDMDKRTVTYLSSDERDSHTEYVPNHE